jgi:hypothetical protein
MLKENEDIEILERNALPPELPDLPVFEICVPDLRV